MTNITNSSGEPMIWQGVEILPGETKFIQIENATAPSWQMVKPVGWQPIKTAPKDGTKIDLWADNQRIAHCCWETWVNRWMRIDQFKGGMSSLPNQSEPTHWMPLPAAPKEQPNA